MSRAALAAWLTVATAAVAGCGASPKQPETHTLRHITNESQYVYPLDSFLPSSNEQNRYGQAFKAIVEGCVNSYGLRYSPVGRSVESPYLWDPNNGTFDIYNNGAGVVSKQRASQYGYHDPVPVKAVPAPDEPAPTKDLLLVVNGSDSPTERHRIHDRDGNPVQQHGCFGEAFDALGGKGPELPDLESTLDTSNDNVGSSEYADALKAWVTCMKAKGHADAESPQTYGFRYGLAGAVGPQETELALDDVACKATSRVADVYVATRRTLQQRYIANNQLALDAYRKWAKTTTQVAVETLRGDLPTPHRTR